MSKARLLAYTAALNRFDFDTVEALFAPDAVYVSAGVGGTIVGRQAIMLAFKVYFAEHPDQVNEDSNIQLLGPNAIKADWKLRATNIKSGMHIQRRGTQIVSFDAQGKIVRIEVFDVA